MIDNEHRSVTDRSTAYSLYTDPPLGRIGLTEAEVRPLGRPALMAKIRIVLPHARSGYSRPGPWSAPRIDRLAGDGGHKIAAEMAETSVKGLQHLEVRDDEGEKVAREIKFKRIIVLPPIGKQKRYPSLDLTVIHASERGAPKGRKPIEWKLDHGSASAQPCRGDRGDKLAGQALENRSFPKILKSGCKAAESKLRTAERLANRMDGDLPTILPAATSATPSLPIWLYRRHRRA